MPLANVIRGVSIFMLRSLCVLLLLSIGVCLPGGTAFAQFTYTIDQSIPVEINGRSLSLAWAGGLNSAQVNKMDFDGDGNEDLVVFDRSADKIMPYRNAGGAYEYAPDYELLFPEAVSQWMLLRDINCDGKKDIFTSDPFGIVAYVNTTKPGQQLSWRQFNPGFPLLTKGFSGNINLKINDVDIPAIDDVDNDGDLDILSMRFVGVGTVEWHKNMSIENTGVCDSLQLERVTQTYGGVEECTCGVFAFGGEDCDLDGGRIQHVGGKTLLNIDIDNDGDHDLLYSEETCPTVYLFTNEGDKDNPVFESSSFFPQPSPASFSMFPAPFFEDVDFDGLTDLVVSPNLYSRQFENVLVRNSLWFYKNTGTADQPTFTFMQNDFLQENMIDVGDYSTPTLFDTDNDGDEDLFIGFYGDENFRGSMYYFENVGSANAPMFRQITSDYAGLSFLLIYNVKPQAADINGDGNTDLAFTATNLQDGITSLYYIPNRSDVGFDPDLGGLVQTSLQIGNTENVFVTDVTRDGTPDLLIGKATGALQFWENMSNDGMFSTITLRSGSYLGLSTSTSRQNPSVVAADLNADGMEDLIVGDQRGTLSFYNDYRNFNVEASEPVTEVLYNALTQQYHAPDFGGRTRLAVGNLFNSSKPAVVVGNGLGGLFVLRNDTGDTLPEDPVIGVGPNPLERGDGLKVRSDRNTRVQVFSILGQKMTELIPVLANQQVPLNVEELAAGMYVARFTFPGKQVSVKFILK